jgi:hypothetical protein
LTDDEAKAKRPTLLFDDLRQRVKDGKVAFNFNLELAQAGDKIDNATVPLPEGRKKVNLGALKVTSVAEDSGGACLAITFNPLVLPKGSGAVCRPVDCRQGSTVRRRTWSPPDRRPQAAVADTAVISPRNQAEGHFCSRSCGMRGVAVHWRGA